MGIRVSIDRDALRRHLRSDPGAQQALDETVQALQSAAERATPVKTGYAQRRYRWRRYSLFRRLGNTDPFMHLIEFGSVNNPVYAPMRRAARSIGLRFRESPKP